MDFPEPMKLRDLLERFEPFACRPADQRPALSGVFFKPDNHQDIVIVAATDGHRLSQTLEYAPGLADVLPAKGLVVPLQELGKVQKYLHRRKHCPAGTLEPLAGNCCGFLLKVPGRAQTGTGQHGWTDGSIKVRCLPGTDFPNYWQCYPEGKRQGWYIEDRCALAEACRELAAVAEKGAVLVMSWTDGKIHVQAWRDIPGGVVRGEVEFPAVPRDEVERALQFRANALYLADAFEFVRECELYPGEDDLQPVLLRSTDASGLCDSALVMPVRLL